MKIKVSLKNLNFRNMKKELTSEQIKKVKNGKVLVFTESGVYYE